MRPVLLLIYLFFTTGIVLLAQDDVVVLRHNLITAPNDSERSLAYGNIISYYLRSDVDSTQWYISQGLQTFSAKNYTFGLASLMAWQAVEHSLHGKMDTARLYYGKAMTMYTSIHNARGIANTHNGLGVLDCKTARYDEAASHFMAALKEYDQLHDTDGLASTYLKLGVLNEERNDLLKAEQYFKTVITLTDAARLKQTLKLNALNNLGIVSGKRHDLKKAIAYLEQAMAISATYPGLAGMQVAMLTNMGIAYTDMGNDAKALKCYEQGLAIVKDKDMPDDAVRLLMNRSAIIRKKDPARGIQDLNTALAMAKGIDHKLMEMDIYDDMTGMFAALGDYKSAYNSFRQMKQLADTVFNLNKEKEIAHLLSVYELERANQRVAALELQSSKSHEKRTVIVLVAIGLAMALMVLLIMYRKSKQLNSLLAKREEELQRSNTVKDKLFSVIGHDLRGPVGNIPGMLQLLGDNNGYNIEQKALIANLSDHAQASMETLDKLLYWGQAQIKGPGTNIVPFIVNDYLRQNLKLIKNSAAQKNITVTDKIPEGINVLADTTHFEFIIRNLLSNAVKFTNANGMVELLADKEHTQGTVVFAVRDNGVGISKESLVNIFEPFSASRMGTANERGTSIGLMLCNEFVKENGGRIWAESEPGKGSTFYFTLRTS